MKPFDVLVISPDNKQAEAEVSGLGVCGLSAEAVHSVREALWQLNTHSYSFILLDQKTAESEMLMEAVKWGEECFCCTANVTEHICSLRRKLGLDAKDKHYIETVHGFGYRFCKKKQAKCVEGFQKNRELFDKNNNTPIKCDASC